eukprot:gene13568-biopygen2003
MSRGKRQRKEVQKNDEGLVHIVQRVSNNCGYIVILSCSRYCGNCRSKPRSKQDTASGARSAPANGVWVSPGWIHDNRYAKRAGNLDPGPVQFFGTLPIWARGIPIWARGAQNEHSPHGRGGGGFAPQRALRGRQGGIGEASPMPQSIPKVAPRSPQGHVRTSLRRPKVHVRWSPGRP